MGVPGRQPRGRLVGGQRLPTCPAPAPRGSELLRRLVHRRDAGLAHRLASGRHRGVRPRRRPRVVARLGGAGGQRGRMERARRPRPDLGRRTGVSFSAPRRRRPCPHRTSPDLPVHGGDTMWRFRRLLYPLPRPARSVQAVRNIDYVGDGIAGPSPRHHPAGGPTRRTAAPVLVYIHGGAWVIGDKREQGLPLLHELARRGWVTVTINYRLSPRATWPDHIVDCKRALVWVREHIAEYGGDPGFIAVSGGSAGGHLCALLALTPGDHDFQPGFEDARHLGGRVCAVLRRLRHDRRPGHLGSTTKDSWRCSSAGCSSARSPTTRRSSRPRPPCTGSTPTHHRSSSCTGPTTRWSRWPTPGFCQRPPGGVQVARALRRASLHPACLRRAPVGPQRPRGGGGRAIPRGNPRPPTAPGRGAATPRHPGRRRRAPGSFPATSSVRPAGRPGPAPVPTGHYP